MPARESRRPRSTTPVMLACSLLYYFGPPGHIINWEVPLKRIQQGFTLIELMIVVAIVGILAAIALPAYQDYTIRARVSEAAAAAGACKTGVAEFFASKASLPTDTAQAGCSGTAA